MEKRQNDLQEIMVVQKSVKWMINLGIPLIVGLLSYNAITLDKLKDADSLQKTDIAVLQEQMRGVMSFIGHKVNNRTSYLDILYVPKLRLEAILPKEDHMLEFLLPNKAS
jgi:hypothetical protein